MERLLLVVGGVVVAAAVAWVTSRRVDPPGDNTHSVPRRLDRREFLRPEADWLVAVFTSAGCSTCAGVWERARALDSDAVAVQELELDAARELHERYGIDAVPTLVIADRAGEVRRAFLGPTSSADLWSAVAEVRDGSEEPGR